MYKRRDIIPIDGNFPSPLERLRCFGLSFEENEDVASKQNSLSVVNEVACFDADKPQKSHKMEGAAHQLHISESTARNYHTDFIRLVGFCYGLEDGEEETG